MAFNPQRATVGSFATDVDLDTLPQLRNGLTRMYQVYLPVDHVIDFSHMNLGVDHDFEYFTKGGSGADPEWERTENGLTLLVNRPGNVPEGEGVGFFAGVRPDRIGLATAARFLIIATFRRPVQTAWDIASMPGYQPSPLFRDGSWAATLQLMTPGAELPGMGVTCQFTTGGTRMNLPRTEVLNDTNRRPFLADIAPAAEARMLDPADPANFTLILDYDRTRTPDSGFAALYVGQDVADSLSFDFFKMASVPRIEHILVGVGTASGNRYKAQLDLIDLQVWAPFP